jgi:hypothetical protein
MLQEFFMHFWRDEGKLPGTEMSPKFPTTNRNSNRRGIGQLLSSGYRNPGL